MSVSINGTSGITFNDSTTQATAFTSGMRNRIINGAMVIDQRNAGASVAGNGVYTLDRWLANTNTVNKFNVQQNAGSVTPPAGFSNYLGVTSSSAYTLAAGEFTGIVQNIEGFNTADLNWGTANAQTVTLSFWVRSSLTGSFGAALRNSAGNRSYPFSYTISSANTWEQKSVTIAGDTTGTWVGATNGTGIQVWISLGSGSTFSGTANAWAAASLIQPTGSVSVVATNGATFYITGVQLEKGSVATPFEYTQYQQELALCQRYYFRGTYWGSGLADASRNLTFMINLPVTMRTQPSVNNSSDTSGIAANGNLYNLDGASAVILNSWWSGSSMGINVTTSTQITQYTIASGRLLNLQCSAEL
jgi:hypothetical protein